MAALTKGWGFFSSTVQKTAQTVNQQVLQPTAQRLAESELAKTAAQTAAQVGQRAAETGRAGFEGFTKFVEGPAGGAQGAQKKTTTLDEDKQDFWESFGQPSERVKPSALGTSAMKKPGNGNGFGGGF